MLLQWPGACWEAFFNKHARFLGYQLLLQIWKNWEFGFRAKSMTVEAATLRNEGEIVT